MIEINAHRLVAQTCEEMANAVYEELATRHPNWYAVNKDRRAFVKKCAPTLREAARQNLAELLGRPDIDPTQKELIHEALVLDAAIPRSGYFKLDPYTGKLN